MARTKEDNARMAFMITLAVVLVAVIVGGSYIHTLIGSLITFVLLVLVLGAAGLWLCWRLYGETPRAVFVRIRNEQ
jgi:hypothetical protein